MVVSAKKPTLNLVPKEHFWVSGIKRAFELTALVPLYVYVSNNLENIERNKDIEFTIGSSTVVYEVDEYDNINLITGWKGKRKSKNKRDRS